MKNLGLQFRQLLGLIIVSLLLFFPFMQSDAQKFLGNIIQNTPPSNFSQFWNQVTPENSSKWDACEPSRDNYNWGNLDNAYNFANQNGMPFKGHTFVWGSQEPNWIGGLSQSEQRAEVEEWIRDYFQRYPGTDYIDVVNEPLHAPASYRDALGGSGSTGWDWVVTAFEIARQYAPSGCRLLINEYGIISDPNAANDYVDIINILNNRGLIDGIGIQCHAFNMDNVTTSTMNQVLNILSGTGLPIYVSELDIRGNDSEQLQRYQDKFPVLWNNSNVEGITLWGYIEGTMWQAEAWLVSQSGSQRPAMQWLMDYVGSSSGTSAVWLEAECGTVGSLWDVVSDGNASNDQYVTIQSGNNSTGSAPTSSSGQIIYDFNVGESGTYNVWARVITPSGTDDSFWISMDGGSWFQWNNIGPNSSWAWELSQSYNLNAGNHTLTIAYREDGALLDKIYISNTGDTPTGEGSAADNCSGTCDPTPITPYISVNDGSWQQISSVSVSSGDKVELGPQPSTGGSWSWTGCGTSGTTREQTIYPTSSCTATATYTNTCGAQSTQNFNITVSGGSGDTDVWLEAECGVVGSLWTTPSDGNASNDQYVTIQSGNNSTGSAPSSTSGHITYTFDVSESGTYTVWARVITPNGTDDSFWLQMDGGSWFMWNNIGPTSNWAWEQAQSYSLSSGNHTFTVAYREDGAQLDKLYITNSGDTPSGEGSAASNCGGSPPPPDDYSITVRASGTAGSEQIRLSVGGTAVQTWTLSTSMSNYTATTSLSGGIDVEFINDDGTNRDVQIDYIQVGGQTWQAEDQSTNTGVWQDGSCGGSYSEWLHCGGYIGFSAYKSGEQEEMPLPEQNDMLIYPNPATEQLTVILSENIEDIEYLYVYNSMGVLVKQVRMTDQYNRIDISGLLPGMYFIKTNVNNNTIVKNFIKK